MGPELRPASGDGPLPAFVDGALRIDPACRMLDVDCRWRTGIWDYPRLLGLVRRGVGGGVLSQVDRGIAQEPEHARRQNRRTGMHRIVIDCAILTIRHL